MFLKANLPDSKTHCIVSDVNIARLLLEGDAKRGIRQSEKSSLYKKMNPKDFSGIFTKNTFHDGWEPIRKAIAPSFSKHNILKILPKLEGCWGDFENHLSTLEKNKETFNVAELFTRLMLNAITIGMFDVDYQGFKKGGEGEVLMQELHLYVEEYFLKRAFNPFRPYFVWDPTMARANKAVDYLFKLMESVITKYEATYSVEERKTDTSILGHIYRCPYETAERRHSDMITFFFAGYDTSSLTMAWTVIEVTKHPHVLKKLRQELDTVNPDRSNSFEYSHLSQLTYLEMVISESERLRPVAAGGQGRVAEVDIDVPGGYVIPKGTECMLPFISIFRQGIKVSEIHRHIVVSSTTSCYHSLLPYSLTHSLTHSL